MRRAARAAGSAVVTACLAPVGLCWELAWLLTPRSRRDPEPPLGGLWRWPARWWRTWSAAPGE